MARKKRSGNGRGSTNNPSISQPERTFEVDWKSICTSRQDLLDTNYILSKLCSQLKGDELDDKDGKQSQDTEAEEDNPELDDGELEMWESKTTDQSKKEKSILAEAALKSRFLDRLTEVLARVKRPPEAVEQVASAYMAETSNDDGSQRVEIRLAKNEGLSDEDKEYLEELFGILMQIARGGTVNPARIEDLY